MRLIGSPTAREVQETIAAVQLVNAGLPESAKLVMGETIPNLSFPDDPDGRSNWTLENVIAVDYQEAEDAFEEDGSRTEGASYADNQFRADGSINWSYIRMGRTVGGAGSTIRQDLTGQLAHELVHALGVYGHVDPFAYRSLMNAFGSKGILWPTDREALRVLYGRLQPGDFLPFGFGPWHRTRYTFTATVHMRASVLHFVTAMQNRGHTAISRMEILPTIQRCPLPWYGLARCSALGRMPLRYEAMPASALTWNRWRVGQTSRGLKHGAPRRPRSEPARPGATATSATPSLCTATPSATLAATRDG